MMGCDYGLISDQLLGLLHALIQYVTTFYSLLLHTHTHKETSVKSHVFTVVVWWRFQRRKFPFLWISNCTQSQVQASNSNSSQRMDSSSSLTPTRNQLQYNGTTDILSASLSWCQAPIYGPYPDLYYHQRFQVCWCGATSLTRGLICSLQLLLGLASAGIFGPESRRIHDHILLPQIWDSLNLEDQVPIFISLRNSVVKLYCYGSRSGRSIG
jgi:hypothetical protein